MDREPSEPGPFVATDDRVDRVSPLAASVRAARLDAVGGAFLRLRPRVVAPSIAFVTLVLATGGEPPLRLALLAALTLALVGGFAWEARRTRMHRVDARWLARSLALTLVGITVACALTGGLPSPLLPMFFAPTVVAFAAFGRGRESTLLVALVALALGALALARVASPWPPIASPRFELILAGSTMVALVLLRSGVGGLADAHARTEQLLDRMRMAVLEDSSERLRTMESVGAKVAHEVRNPLASIKGLVQLLSRRSSDPREERRFSVILSEIDRLNTIVDDYLSFARPLHDLEPAHVDLEELLAHVAAVVEPSARERGVRVERHGEPGVVLGDRRKLEAALLNLATNALAASDAGGCVSLRARVEGDAILLEIEDHGAGMDDATLAKIGTPYFTTKERGAGLGVALARATIAQHGGTLGYESRLGEGTIARVRLPMAR